MPIQSNNSPEEHYENDAFDYESQVYRCSSCEDDIHNKNEIFFDHLSNGNICRKCLHNEDLPFILGFDIKRYQDHINKVVKQEPISFN